VNGIERRVVPLGPLKGATLLGIIVLENAEVRLSFRRSDGTVSELGFSSVEAVTNQAANGMVLDRLTEHAMSGSRLPSRFVFENTDRSRALAIRGRASGQSLLTDPLAMDESRTVEPLDAALATEDAYSGLLELAGLLAVKSGGVPGALSHEEEVVHSLTGIDLQVSNGGWLQWLYNTEPWRLGRAVADLRELGLPKVAEIAGQVLQIGALRDPRHLTAKDRDDIVSRVPESSLLKLSALDGPYYGLQDECARSARHYVLQHRAAFDL